jgi:hypothetical protein
VGLHAQVDTFLAVVESFSNNPILRAGNVDLCPSRCPAAGQPEAAISSEVGPNQANGDVDPDLWRKQRAQVREHARVHGAASASKQGGALSSGSTSSSKIGSSKISLLIDVPLFSAHLYWWADPKNALQDHSSSPTYG